MGRPVMPRSLPILSEDGAFAYVPLTKNRYALVNGGDWPMISAYNWCAVSKPNGRWYAYRGRHRADGPGGSLIAMHTQLTGWPEVDHISRDGLDNRRANLRSASRSNNNGNHTIRADSRNRYKGVYARTNGTWIASVRRDGRSRHLGTFKTEEDAAHAYDAAAREAFGPFARLNFPEDQ